jgi:tetratricopeptide (TPR) repeat protein
MKRIALLFVVVLVAFAAFYAIDRFRAPAAPIVDRERAVLEEAVRADPADIAARGQLADIYLAAERYDEAIAQYSEIIATGKADKPGYASRARAYELKGELDAAVADYTKVVALTKDTEMANVDPVLEGAYYGLGAIALQQDRAQDAVDFLSKALAIKRSDADAMNLLGAAYVKVGQPDKAIVALSKAIEFVPIGWADPYLSLQQAYTAGGDRDLAEWAGAMADLAAGDTAAAESRLVAISSGPAAVRATVGLGLVMESKGDSPAAADWYRKALALDATNVSAKLGLSRVGSGTATSPAPSTEGSN